MHIVTYKTLRSICSPNKANKRQRMIVEAKSSSGGSSDPVPHLACKLDFRGHGEVPATALDLIPDRKWRVLHLGKLRMLGFSEWVPAPLFDDRSIADTSNKSCAPSADTKATALANPSIDRNAVSAVTVHPGSHSSKVSQRIRAIQGDWVHSGGGLVKVKPLGDALKITNPYFRVARCYRMEDFFQSDVAVSYEGHTGVLDEGKITWSNGSVWTRERPGREKQLVCVFLWPLEPVVDYFGKLDRGEVPAFEVRVAAHAIEGEDLVIEEATLPMIGSSPETKTMSKRYFRRVHRRTARGPLARSLSHAS